MQHRGWIEHADRRGRCSLVRLRLLLQHLIERGVQVALENRTAGVWALVPHGIRISVAPRDKMLSRGAALAHLTLFNLPPRSLFEQGPPGYLRDEMQRVLQLAEQTRPLLAQARSRLGWPQRQ